MIYGFDASHLQGKIPWSNLDPRIRFGIFKCIQGNDGKDPSFDRNVRECTEAGLIPGAYHFAYPLPHLDPRKQAQDFFEQSGQFGSFKGQLPPFIDLEWPEPSSWGKWKVNGKTIAEWTEAHLDECTKLWGIKPILYTYDMFWSLLRIDADVFGVDISWAANYELWMAWYNVKHPGWPVEGDKPRVPPPFKRALFWQFDGNGGMKLPNGVDSDFCVFDGTEEELRALADGPRLREQDSFEIVHPFP